MNPNAKGPEFMVEMDAEQLHQAGIYKPDDLSRATDLGRVQEILANAGIDEELNPLAAEKAMRDADFEAQAGSPAQPERPHTRVSPDDRLAQMQAELDAAKAEADRYKHRYGIGENEKGSLRRRLREIEEMVQGRGGYPAPQAQTFQQPFNPGLQGGIDPNTPVTAADLHQAMLAFAAAQGNAIRQSQEQTIREARGLRNYDLTTDEEEDLYDENPWLKSLPPGQREQAMLKIARPANGRSQPPGTRPNNFTPKPPTQEEILRARVRQTGFVEAPSGASVQERTTQSAADAHRAQLLQKAQEALRRNDGKGSQEMEKILAAMGAGVTDDMDRGFPRR